MDAASLREARETERAQVVALAQDAQSPAQFELGAVLLTLRSNEASQVSLSLSLSLVFFQAKEPSWHPSSSSSSSSSSSLENSPSARRRRSAKRAAAFQNTLHDTYAREAAKETRLTKTTTLKTHLQIRKNRARLGKCRAFRLAPTETTEPCAYLDLGEREREREREERARTVRASRRMSSGSEDSSSKRAGASRAAAGAYERSNGHLPFEKDGKVLGKCRESRRSFPAKR